MAGRTERILDISAALAGATARRLAALAYSTPLYHLTLRGPMPDHIVFRPEDLWPTRAGIGEAILKGRIELPGGQARAGDGSFFDIDAPTPRFAEELHGFGWLRHVNACTAPDKADRVQEIVADWLETRSRWDDVAWQPHVIARRLIAWSTYAPLILEGGDLIFRSDVLRSMAEQARHLSRVAPRAKPGLPRITATLGLALSGLCLSEGRTRLKRGLALLGRELERQIMPDGGHLSRNPEAQLVLLADLVSLRDALMARDVEVPTRLRNALDRTMPMLRFFRHGDARLALFNGASEGPEGAVDAVLAHDDAQGRPFGFAPHSGFQRAAAGRTLMIVDAGAPPAGPYSTEAHAGCLSFELSAGRHRLITNCGTAVGRGAAWEDATRATAAHSTLVVDDTSSARIAAKGWRRALLGPRILDGPRFVESRRTEDEDGIALDMRHDGYLRLFGLEHERRLVLSTDGDDLRGEDGLWRAATPKRAWWDPFGMVSGLMRREEPSEPFAIRFHLHPDVRVSLAHDGTRILMLLPNGDGWQFHASTNAELALEESVYLGRLGDMRRTQQIVVTHHVFRGEAQVKWGFRRLTTRNLGTAEPAYEDESAEEKAQADAFAELHSEDAEPVTS